jgi:serine/threonine protein kinase
MGRHDGFRGSYWNEGDLHKHMTTARRKFMPVKEIARYMQQLLRGLAHLHKHKVVHCDVSPQNVFLRRDREVIMPGMPYVSKLGWCLVV